MGEDRFFQGNEGYEDIVDEVYRYDTTVANYRAVQEGDTVVLRDKTRALGIARIERIEVTPGATKTRNLCPRCRTTNYVTRKVQRPRFHCRRPCNHSFDEPEQIQIPVTQFAAHYPNTWVSLDGGLSRTDLEDLALNRSQQQSMRELDRNALTAHLDRLSVTLPAAKTSSAEGRTRTRTRSRSRSISGGTRQRSVQERINQGPFRSALLERFGLVCAVTGPCPAEVLQAAHLRDFATHQTHVVDEGLLLRSDIHQLFDAGLLWIDPDDLTVRLSPRVAEHPQYCQYDYQVITVAALATDTTRAALRDRLAPGPEHVEPS